MQRLLLTALGTVAALTFCATPMTSSHAQPLPQVIDYIPSLPAPHISYESVATVPSEPTKPEAQFVTFKVTAYTNSVADCGKTDGVTASGKTARAGITAACPPFIPFGTKLYVKGVGTFTCQDRGSAIQGNHIDLYMSSEERAIRWGVKFLQVEVLGRLHNDTRSELRELRQS